MNEQRRPVEGCATDWLARARSALVLARQRAQGILLEDLCYQTQQAAEKALKAVCLHEGIRFPFTHDVRYLLRLLSDEGVDVPGNLLEAAILTDYAVATRYPSAAEPVSEEDYAEAVRLAAAVLRWAETKIDRDATTEKTEERDSAQPAEASSAGDKAPEDSDGNESSGVAEGGGQTRST